MEGGFRLRVTRESSVHCSYMCPICSVCDMFKGLSVQCVLQIENGEKRGEK